MKDVVILVCHRWQQLWAVFWCEIVTGHHCSLPETMHREQEWAVAQKNLTVAWVCSTTYIQGCQLSRFSRKLPEFEAHFTRLWIFDETPEFRTHRHIFTAKRHRTKESTCRMCSLCIFKAVNCKKHAECQHWHRHSVDYSHLDIPQPTNPSYSSYGLKVNKNRGSSNCTKGKKHV